MINAQQLETCVFRHVKSTSPRVNVLVLIGAALYLPRPLMSGILISGTRYNLAMMKPVGDTFCQVCIQLYMYLDSRQILFNLINLC